MIRLRRTKTVKIPVELANEMLDAINQSRLVLHGVETGIPLGLQLAHKQRRKLEALQNKIDRASY